MDKNLKADDFIAPPCNGVIEILYQDDSILVINKPTGLLSLSGKNPLNKDSVHYRIVQAHPTALMVHRLDLGTSGIMVLALSKEIVKNLNQQFSNRSVKKTYQAMVTGSVAKDKGVIELPIGKAIFPYQKICHQTGKAASTEFNVLHRFTNKTLLELKPHTGRTHQLRVHCAAIGHSIMGDDLYGGKAEDLQVQNSEKRLMLHATGLSFEHPVTKKSMNFFLPPEFSITKLV